MARRGLRRRLHRPRPVRRRPRGLPFATPAQVAARADLAVHGRVKSVESRWNRDRSAIYSDVTVEVVRMVGASRAAASNRNVRAKAAGAAAEVTLRVPGGEVGDVGMAVSHASRARVGEEVVVLLAAPSSAAAAPAGSPAPEMAALDADGQTLTVAGGEEAWLRVRSGAVDLGAGRRAPVAELLSTLATSLKK